MERCSAYTLDPSYNWDPFELWAWETEDDPPPCQNLATCRYYNGTEWIPLCAPHYDIWVKRCGESEIDLTLPKFKDDWK